MTMQNNHENATTGLKEKPQQLYNLLKWRILRILGVNDWEMDKKQTPPRKARDICKDVDVGIERASTPREGRYKKLICVKWPDSMFLAVQQGSRPYCKVKLMHRRV
jgi:hypothetical protein